MQEKIQESKVPNENLEATEDPDGDALNEACPKCGSYFGSTCRCENPVELPFAAFTKLEFDDITGHFA